MDPRGRAADAAQWPLVTYVGDVETAMANAKEAAGRKDVLVHGVGTAQLALAAGVSTRSRFTWSRLSTTREVAQASAASTSSS